MKITLVGPVYPYRGGIAHFTTSLFHELTAAGSQVQVISFRRQYPAWLYPGQSDKDPSAKHEQFPTLYTLDPFYFWTWGKAVRQMVDFQPDVVIIQWWTTFWAPAFFSLASALKRRGIPCVFCIHNVFPHENRPPDLWLARAVLSRASGLITLSPKETGRLKKILPAARVFPSRLPVPKTAPLGIDRSQARKQLGISADQLVLLFFGIVRPYKGLSVLIEALGILKAQGIQPVLIVAGEFWENIEQYRQQIGQLGLQDQIILENRYLPDEDLPPLFCAADAFVAPYTQGTQSAAIKMAMGYRLPILSSDQISFDLDPARYPILIHKAGDAGDLADSVRSFLHQERKEVAFQEKNDWDDLVSLIHDLGTQVYGQKVSGKN